MSQPGMRIPALAIVVLCFANMLGTVASETPTSESMQCAVADGAHVLRASGDGLYVKFKFEPAPPPLGDLFAIRALACTDSHQPVDGTLHADAIMPAHGHGMNYAVQPVPTVAGAATLQGFLWQMPGLWQLKFRLQTQDQTYRATYDYTLAPR